MTKSHLPRLTAFLLSLLLMLTAVMTPLSADDTAAVPVFTDVKESDWFYSGVYGIVKTGLMIGTSDTTFSPKNYITTAECVTLLARMHALVTGSTSVLQAAPATNPWYQTFINYCNAHALLSADMQMLTTEFITQPMSRAQLIALFSALPDTIWTEINTVETGAIPDVPVGAAYEEPIYRAYRCGIIVGDDKGNFNPDQPISRAEVAAIVIRIVDPAMRQSISLSSPKLKLYAADGSTVTVTREEKEAYLAFGWRETAYPAKFDAEYVLNEMPLYPTKTGYATLDNMIDALFAKILTEDMTTYEKVSAVYDYLVRTSTYGRSPVSGKYRPIYKQSPYLDPAPDLKTPLRTALSGYSGYDYFYIALKDHDLEAYTIMYASEMLDGKTGLCDHFSSAFAVMMRRLGLPAIPLYVNSLSGSTYAPHMTSMMTVGGVDCYFDPQIEAVLVGRTGKNEHKRFCRPMAEMTKEYLVSAEDIAINKALFGTFVYDAEKMEKILKDK